MGDANQYKMETFFNSINLESFYMFYVHYKMQLIDNIKYLDNIEILMFAMS